MKGFILSAGFGTRLKPLTDFIPKALVPVCGKTLLERSIESFVKGGIDNIALNTHYKHEAVEEWLEDNGHKTEVFNEEKKILGTGGGLRNAAEFLETDDLFIVRNVDIVTDIDIAAFAKKVVESGAIGGLAAVPAGETGTLVYDEESMSYFSTDAQKDMKKGRRCADFTGIAAYRKEFLKYVKRDDFSVLSSWHNALKAGESIKVVLFPGIYWYDCGSLKSLFNIHSDCINERTDISIPENYIRDREKKCVYPEGFDPGFLKNVKGNVWFDSSGLKGVESIENSIVYPEPEIKGRHKLKNVIAARWGIIPFE